MSGPVKALLPGNRLHLQHGPIDLIIGADGERDTAFAAAEARFSTVLAELVDELVDLREPMSEATQIPVGETAKRMHGAVSAFLSYGYVTRMAAVAGSVAESVLAAMVAEAKLRRAYVNNGGDIALHLAQGEEFSMAMASERGADLGRVVIRPDDGVRGVATSGRGGRSLSLGIADSVTVLAGSASEADVAATLIANAVDLPGHPGIRRQSAKDVREDSDLGELPVVVGCGPLSGAERDRSLAAGLQRANDMMQRGLIVGAALFLQGESRTVGQTCLMDNRLLPV